MSEEKKDGLGRREFTTAMALALLGGATITLSGCGGGYGGGGNPSGPTGGYGNDGGNGVQTGDVQGVVSANHGHVAIIKKAELDAGGALNLDIHGSADHTHSVSLSADEIVSIRGGGRVSKPSSTTVAQTNGTHSHTVTFN